MTRVLSSNGQTLSTSDRSPVSAWLALIAVAFMFAGCSDFGPIREAPTDPFGGIHGQ
jgi:hypothetical protein